MRYDMKQQLCLFVFCAVEKGILSLEAAAALAGGLKGRVGRLAMDAHGTKVLELILVCHPPCFDPLLGGVLSWILEVG